LAILIVLSNVGYPAVKYIDKRGVPSFFSIVFMT